MELNFLGHSFCDIDGAGDPCPLWRIHLSTNRVHRNIPCNGRLVMEPVPTESTGTSRVMVGRLVMEPVPTESTGTSRVMVGRLVMEPVPTESTGTSRVMVAS
ncbi:hypothetical protein RRG08_030430 [Elysia crispata]|uniref:Uncharacterized protein n=1 Tax=Elysia crispata TaxID=231223 RepID=A0AAE1E8W3_9GAST|nr:hypothetical protein RRG08_030430 [Elysia crispata]